MNTIQIDTFTIQHEGNKVTGVVWPDDYPADVQNAAADYIEAMAVEIIKMRELLQAVHKANSPLDDREAQYAVDEYINNLPK